MSLTHSTVLPHNSRYTRSRRDQKECVVGVFGFVALLVKLFCMLPHHIFTESNGHTMPPLFTFGLKFRLISVNSPKMETCSDVYFVFVVFRCRSFVQIWHFYSIPTSKKKTMKISHVNNMSICRWLCFFYLYLSLSLFILNQKCACIGWWMDFEKNYRIQIPHILVCQVLPKYGGTLYFSMKFNKTGDFFLCCKPNVTD